MNEIKTNLRVDVRYGEKNPETGAITWKSEKMSNLINNDGLSLLSTYWACQCTEYVYLESGGRANVRSSGANLLSQAGTTVTSDDPFFLESDADNNRLLVLENGTKLTIVGFVSDSEVEVLEAGTVSNKTAAIYYVEESFMDGFVKASNTYETYGGANTNTWSESAGILTLENKRTVSFPVEGSDVTYKAAGWTPLSVANSAVFGRKVMDIVVSGGSQPIVEVTLTRRIDCTAITVNGNTINGVAGTAESMNMMGSAAYNGVAYWSSINTSTGATVAPTETSTFMECKSSENARIALGEYSTALALGNVDITGSTYASTSIAPIHTAGTFYIDYKATFTPNEFDTASWNTVALLNDADVTEAWWRLLFDSTQDFSNKILKGLTIRKSWSRYY